MIECVIFDLDGLMVNTEVIARTVYKEEALKLGYKLDDDFFKGITGSTLHESKKYFDKYDGLINHVQKIMIKRREAIFKASNKKGFLNKKGLIALLDYLFLKNIKVCIATSSDYEYAKKLLNSIGKEYKFDAICTGDMVKNHKPNPDIFLLAKDKVNIPSENCLVLEDSKNGIIAAKNAKMKVGFIYDTIEEDEIMKNLYDFKFNSLDEVIKIL